MEFGYCLGDNWIRGHMPNKVIQNVSSLKPIIDERSRALILGSMPGEESIKKQEYYANGNNHFWKIIYCIFDSEYDQAYEKRISFVLRKGIALWDVLAKCEREGSSDSKIWARVANDFASLFKNYPNINCVFFNGQEAFKSYKKLAKFDFTPKVILKKLTSSSPANTRKTFQDKVGEWQVIRNCFVGK
jgi:hypoxanthine-DNA glycosylase